MRATDLVPVCAAAMTQGITPYVEGPPGIGKSALAYAIQEYMELDWVFMFNAPQHDPVDVVGVPSVSNGMTVWNPPKFVPEDTGRGGLIVIEELAQSVSLMQNALCPLILERRLGRWNLPDNIFVYATGNRQEDRAGANRILSHVANRLMRLEMGVHPDDWFAWAMRNKLHEAVLGFLRFKPGLLHKFDPAQFSNPTPRAWEKVSKIVEFGLPFAQEFGAVSGLVGEGAAVEFKAHREVASKLPDFDKILADPASVPAPVQEPSVLYSLVYGLLSRVGKETVDNMIKYLEKLPKEYSVLAMKELLQQDTQYADIKAVSQWVIKNQYVL